MRTRTYVTDTHRHKWEAETEPYEGIHITCATCDDGYLSDEEIERRLNAVEELDELIKFLQEEDGPNEMGGPFVAVSVIAARLEGDDA